MVENYLKEKLDEFFDCEEGQRMVAAAGNVLDPKNLRKALAATISAQSTRSEILYSCCIRELQLWTRAIAQKVPQTPQDAADRQRILNPVRALFPVVLVAF